jgi:hypothetical protein
MFIRMMVAEITAMMPVLPHRVKAASRRLRSMRIQTR